MVCSRYERGEGEPLLLSRTCQELVVFWKPALRISGRVEEEEEVVVVVEGAGLPASRRMENELDLESSSSSRLVIEVFRS